MAPFNKRINTFQSKRKYALDTIRFQLKDDKSSKIWFHVASLGEFEQARPVIEGIKRKFPNHKIAVSFFSPSGYETRYLDKVIDIPFYLPDDNDANAKIILDLLNPEMVFWVKYDFWYFYLREINSRKIPLYLISGNFRKDQLFFKYYGGFYRDILKFFTKIFTQNQSSADLLKSININDVIVSKDTRYDRVLNTLQKPLELGIISKFKGDNLLLVCGSSYHKEEGLVRKFLNNNNVQIKIIVAPHFIDDVRIKEVVQTFGNDSILYSDADLSNVSDKKVLIIDNIGLLSHIYRYADVAFVGGGFWKGGLHNILEAAAYGMPIIFGPEIKKFPEAKQLCSLNLAFIIEFYKELEDHLLLFLKDTERRKSISEKMKNFIQDNAGATEVVLDNILIH